MFRKAATESKDPGAADSFTEVSGSSHRGFDASQENFLTGSLNCPPVGVLRLRMNSASRTSCSAQDDSFVEGCYNHLPLRQIRLFVPQIIIRIAHDGFLIFLI